MLGFQLQQHKKKNMKRCQKDRGDAEDQKRPRETDPNSNLQVFLQLGKLNYLTLFFQCLGVNEKEAQSCERCGLQKKAYWACDLDDFNGTYPLSQWWELSALVHEKKKASVPTALGKESTAQESAGQGVESQGSVQRGPQNDDEENQRCRLRATESSH